LMVWPGNRQPVSFRGILVVYNISLTLLSLYMFYELVTGLWEGGHNFFCQDTHSGGDADMKIIRVLWWYYFSKLIEFMDTFFFILRKNSHQITVLYVYHHASLLNIWWFIMNWVPCGHSYFGATFNSFIHVLMYSYYGLSKRLPEPFIPGEQCEAAKTKNGLRRPNPHLRAPDAAISDLQRSVMCEPAS
uniref:Elongation of very long chain fatty acids protein n=1 Tax=Leptobrachium leishanense TaxID=445787 RepID=A0A8C5WG72_9ANUR